MAKTVARLSVLQLGLDVFAIGDARIALVVFILAFKLLQEAA
ncbi:MAG: hypothetical protein AAFO01_15600 [Pseudomonadota bacterium]